jgi:hypothetical protein
MPEMKARGPSYLEFQSSVTPFPVSSASLQIQHHWLRRCKFAGKSLFRKDGNRATSDF